jgi:phosphonopyruvate decarboxylase
MKREEAIKIILRAIGKQPIVASTGKINREVFENSLTDHSELIIPGSMGCTAGVALGLALGQKKRIYAIEGDGSMLMGLGTFAMIGHYQADIVHFILDNNAHDSTGGQSTITNTMNMQKLFQSFFYNDIYEFDNKSKLDNFFLLNNLNDLITPAVFIIKVEKGARENLGRPNIDYTKIKERFRKCLNKS